MKVLHREWTGGISIREADGGDGRTLVGLAVPFDVPIGVCDFWDDYDEVFRRGAFTKTITDRARPLPLLGFHDRRAFPLGAATRLEESDAGLEAEFHVSATPDGDAALALIRDRALSGLSIGFEPISDKTTRAKDREPAAPLDLVERTEVRLHEISLVNIPAYADAGVTGVRAGAGVGGRPSLADLATERERLATQRSASLDRWGRVVRR